MDGCLNGESSVARKTTGPQGPSVLAATPGEFSDGRLWQQSKLFARASREVPASWHWSASHSWNGKPQRQAAQSGLTARVLHGWGGRGRGSQEAAKTWPAPMGVPGRTKCIWRRLGEQLPRLTKRDRVNAKSAKRYRVNVSGSQRHTSYTYPVCTTAATGAARELSSIRRGLPSPLSW